MSHQVIVLFKYLRGQIKTALFSMQTRKQGRECQRTNAQPIPSGDRATPIHYWVLRSVKSLELEQSRLGLIYFLLDSIVTQRSWCGAVQPYYHPFGQDSQKPTGWAAQNGHPALRVAPIAQIMAVGCEGCDWILWLSLVSL